MVKKNCGDCYHYGEVRFPESHVNPICFRCKENDKYETYEEFWERYEMNKIEEKSW